MRVTTIRGAARVAAVAVSAGLVLAAPGIASAARFAPPAAPSAHAARVHAASRVAHSASSGCTSAGPTVTDFRGIRYSTRNCHNYRAGDLRLYSITSGRLYAGTNWFVCQSRIGENPPVGGARNDIWLYTEGDVSYSSRYGGWGWFPATYVSGGVNYGRVPGLRWC